MTLTGTASIGISVARQLWRKRNTTSVTRIIASTSVIVTSWIDALTNGVVSNGSAHVTPCGKPDCISFNRSTTACFTASAFAPGRMYSSTNAVGSPLRRPSRS